MQRHSDEGTPFGQPSPSPAFAFTVRPYSPRWSHHLPGVPTRKTLNSAGMKSNKSLLHNAKLKTARMYKQGAAVQITHSQTRQDSKYHLRWALCTTKKSCSKFEVIPTNSHKVTRMLQMKYYIKYYDAAANDNPAAQSAIAHGRLAQPVPKHNEKQFRATLTVCPPFRLFTTSCWLRNHLSRNGGAWFCPLPAADSHSGSCEAYSAARLLCSRWALLLVGSAAL